MVTGFSSRKTLRLVLALLLLLDVSLPAAAQPRPPLTPRWVFKPWMWEDDENTAEAVWDLVRGCERHDIPLGAVIIDSPWETAYNNFRFDTRRYPNPKEFIQQLHQHGVRVIMWITSMINVSSKDAGADTALWRYCYERGYFLGGGVLANWWKGTGSFFDFSHPDGLEFWKSLMDTAFAYGIDGWKVDGTDSYSGVLQSYMGPIDQDQYARLYYCTFASYTQERLGADRGMIVARPRIHGRNRCPVECLISGWVGDQRKDWSDRGFLEALRDIFDSAEHGYAVIGSDIGGYSRQAPIPKRLYIRWAQFGALCPLMETGGRGDHRPWSFDDETVQIYRYYAKLHTELIPYLYSDMIRAHKYGGGIIRPQPGHWQYLLGPDLLVAVVYQDVEARTVDLPPGLWVDYWDESRVFAGGLSLEVSAPLPRIPLFYRVGAVIPMEVVDGTTGHGSGMSAGFSTLALFPGDEPTERTIYRSPTDSFRIKMQAVRPTAAQGSMEISAQGRVGDAILRIWCETEALDVRMEGSPLPALASWSELEVASTGWYWDGRHAWVKIRDWADAAVRINLKEDRVPPRVLCVHAADSTHILVFLSEPIARDQVPGAQSFEVPGGPRVLGVEVDPSRRALVLSTKPLVPVSSYTLRIPSLVDDAGNRSSPQIVTFRYLGLEGGLLPSAFELHPPFPNPFRLSIRFLVDLPLDTWFRLAVYDVLGRRVRLLLEQQAQAGRYLFWWDGKAENGRPAPAGVYLLRLETPYFSPVRKVTLLR